MLRITPTESGNQHFILRLEGRIAGPWVTELRQACEAFLGQDQALELNLADVSFLDSDGVVLLRNIRSRGVELADCSSFVTEQLKTAG
jgi:ABC-type transporter Mla MlaB component